MAKKRIPVPSMLCVHCSYFNEKPQTQKSYKKPQKKLKKKKNHFYRQGVLLVCFWFIRFWFYINCTAQT